MEGEDPEAPPEPPALEPTSSWLRAADLQRPDAGPLAAPLARFAATGGSTNRRLGSASFLLRFGWVSGFAIASYLACGRVPRPHDYAVQFSPVGLLHGFRVRDAGFHGQSWSGRGGTVEAPAPRLRQQLLDYLWQIFEPVIAAQHSWSRYSRHALWSMVTSSWGAQFTSVARQLGSPSLGIAEAGALFALHPELARAAPELYEVCVADAACTCQRRAACCLYFKRPGQSYCASCPLLPEAERLDRNHQWVKAQRPVVCA